jgi:putative FmdB family regulatory protein
MPTYEYKCSSCDHEWEDIQNINDPPLTTCPDCKKEKAIRLISKSSFTLKGSGWYGSGGY